MKEMIVTGLTGEPKTLPKTASKDEIVFALIHAPRSQICSKCGVVMIENWNLAPIGTNQNNTHRFYANDVYLCDECYDNWCSKNNIQPLEKE